jgi:hypothetical protein
MGHTARNGKDSVAGYIKEIYPNTHILHWADHLYEECRNEDNRIPLIKQTQQDDSYFYQIKDSVSADGATKVVIKSANDVPGLHKMFTDRNINVLYGMREKDAELLQFWGTDYRRAQDDLYWVKRTSEDIETIAATYKEGDEPIVILIPDTRFINEFNRIKELGGIYVKVTRLNEDDSLYVSQDRDPNHPSEVNLKDIPGDVEIVAYSGDMKSLNAASKRLIEYALNVVGVVPLAS